MREAVLEAYEEKGILQSTTETWTLPALTFDDVVAGLQGTATAGIQKSAAQGLLSRITPLVVLKVFGGTTTVPFEELVREGSSVFLGGLHTDDLRRVVGQFFLLKLWYYVQNLGPTDTARFYLVLDEADSGRGAPAALPS